MKATRNAKWIDELILQLRLRDVEGPAIGAAVAEVESHLAETGGDARETFGEAHDYANSLQFGDDAITRPLALLPTLVQVSAFVLGWVLLAPAAGAALRGEPRIGISWGSLVSAVAIIAGSCLIVLLLQYLLRRWWALAALLSLVFVAAVAPRLLLPATAFAVPAMATSLVLGVVFIAAIIWTSRLDADLVTDPVTGDERDDDSPRAAAAFTSPWLFLVVMVVLVVMEWLTGARA